jgi:S1-C subfamily serine protease
VARHSLGTRENAKVVKADAYKDLAIIKVDVSGAPHLTLGRSVDVKVLEPAIR